MVEFRIGGASGESAIPIGAGAAEDGSSEGMQPQQAIVEVASDQAPGPPLIKASIEAVGAAEQPFRQFHEIVDVELLHGRTLQPPAVRPTIAVVMEVLVMNRIAMRNIYCAIDFPHHGDRVAGNGMLYGQGVGRRIIRNQSRGHIIIPVAIAEIHPVAKGSGAVDGRKCGFF